ncbi:hypothetical protein Q73_04620 [Bacillus coahuilensis m2-6]|uniref:Uncharacterized protein n=1 Tax=Bacillus coahuilensis p1.1.43 TaxID=1150625 RepID=A0A147KAE2_9BACI|nr:hypothetical protein [Bacillus coahuilensis]KUP07621.1 hypothetical protein Q75_05180 [Bacillus coahuilensis p1.1.43]KUP08767.1 hypothetical protein Q73_04620 [Bacillus coahuilensis m2-6]
MSQYILVLCVLVVLVLIASFIYTLKVPKQHNEEQDKSIPQSVKKHGILANPIFLTYIVAGVLIAFYIIYLIAG